MNDTQIRKTATQEARDFRRQQFEAFCDRVRRRWRADPEVKLTALAKSFGCSPDRIAKVLEGHR